MSHQENKEDFSELMKDPKDMSANEFLQMLLQMLWGQPDEGAAACFSSTAGDPKTGELYSIDWAVSLRGVRPMSSPSTGSRVN